MAPLKPDFALDEQAVLMDLPCLKRHGSIEASMPLNGYGVSWSLPCLKRHGSIEASQTSCKHPANLAYHV